MYLGVDVDFSWLWFAVVFCFGFWMVGFWMVGYCMWYCGSKLLEVCVLLHDWG
jgi:hypothetical protein